MNKKHEKTLDLIFQKPERADIKWHDIEKLFIACGAEITEGNGSRVRVKLNGVLAVFHRPHPQPTAKKGAVKSVRLFLKNANITY